MNINIRVIYAYIYRYLGTAMSSTGPSNNPANDAIENRITLQASREQGKYILSLSYRIY